MKKIEAASQETPSEKGWYVVCSKANQERVAKRELDQQGYEAYLPMRLVQYRRGEVGATPLFPRHLFVRETARWRSIFSTIGVRSVYCIGDNPAVLPHAAMALFHAHEVDGRIRILPAPPQAVVKPCRFTPGQSVRMTTGAFAGLDAVFHERVDANRVVILLRALGRDTRVEMELGDLK